MNNVAHLKSVEEWRFIAVVSVIAIHTTQNEVGSGSIVALWNDPSYLLMQTARFAVPFFFVVSGYFWGHRVAHSPSAMRTSLPSLRRLALLYVAWIATYALPLDFFPVGGAERAPLRAAWWQLHSLLEHPLRLLTQGTSSHLWFLFALICATTISAVLVDLGRVKELGWLAVALYVIQLLTKPYQHSRFGWSMDFDTRNGPFVGTIFFVTGSLLSRRPDKSGWLRAGCFLAVAGLAAHLAENWFVARTLAAQGVQDFVIGTYPFGVGVALMALSGRAVVHGTALSRWSRYVLGIYLVHAIFAGWFRGIANDSEHILGHLLRIAMVLFCSLLTVALVMKTRARVLLS